LIPHQLGIILPTCSTRLRFRKIKNKNKESGEYYFKKEKKEYKMYKKTFLSPAAAFSFAMMPFNLSIKGGNSPLIGLNSPRTAPLKLQQPNLSTLLPPIFSGLSYSSPRLQHT
jgi:hypothetical protein